MKLNSNDKTERKNEGNAKKKKEGLSWGGIHCSYSFFYPKNLKNQFRHLDKLINDLNKSKKTEQKLKINLKPKVFPSLDLVF
jgi:hypothetical protein